MRERRIGRRLVVERAVRLDVLELDAVGAAEPVQRADLVKHALLDLGWRHADGAPAEALQVRVAGLGADAHPELLAQRDGGIHHSEVAGVKAAGEVGAGDVSDHGRVVAQRPAPVAFAQIAVQVYPACRLSHPPLPSVSLERDQLLAACLG